MTERKQVDWERIEAEYRAGQLSVREIARQHGVSAPAIVQKAKRLGWERDLSASVREAVNAKLVKETAAVNSDVNALNAREAVSLAAARGVDIVLRHRRDIAKLDALRNRLAEKAEALIEGVSDLKGLGDAVAAVEGLGRTQAKLIPLERQAFSLDAAGDASAGSVGTKEQRDAAVRAALAADP
jgi:transposase-like protein